MRNPVYQYLVLTEPGAEPYDEGTSHASGPESNEHTLCGRHLHDMDGLAYSRLADHFGVVTCPECMSVLADREVVDFGPRPFFQGTCTVDGIVLSEFGWGIFDRSYEGFFAYGHHSPGAVLEIGRKLSENQLLEWGEYQTTIYAHWVLSDESSQNDGPCCQLAWRKVSDSDKDFPSLKVTPCDVTVLRHSAWPLLHERDSQCEYECRRLRDWYAGAIKLGRSATLDDFDELYAPGYTVCGIPAGESIQTCLEWPTADFEVALEMLNKWKSSGATKLKLSGMCCSVSKHELDKDAGKIIRYGIKQHGRDVPFGNFLEWYTLKRR